MTQTSPHLQSSLSTAQLMRLVIFACIPATVAMTMLYGVGTLINLALAAAGAVVAEAAILALRGRKVRSALLDSSALLTAVLLALAIPPYAAWWLPFVGAIIAIVFAKQLFGGLGMNPFNPAMVAYVVLLISFPLAMSSWPEAQQLSAPIPNEVALAAIFGGDSIDGYTAATPLDIVRNLQGQTYTEAVAANQELAKGKVAGYASEIINVAFLIGGLYLLKRRLFSWHAPVAMLLALGIMSLLFWTGDGSDSRGSPLFHWFSGATMMGAFFIITDPVSGATSNRGRLIFGALVGVMIYLIRAFGNYPDGVAFAVLIANLAAPFIDYYTVPRSYGRENATSVIAKGSDQ